MVDTSNLITYSIAAVERDTGLGKDTLRVWERRYGFPQPLRDANGDRQYPADQVTQLRNIKRLLDIGHRPGKLLAMNGEALAELSQRAFEGDAGSRGARSEWLLSYLEDCRLHRVEALRRSLVQDIARLGLRSFVRDLAAPLVTAVGDCWERGQFQVYEEHLFSEVMQNVIRLGIAGVPRQQSTGPRILLTTFPQEQHSIGLLMAEAMFALEGAQCISLGAGTPVRDIAVAAAQVDVVALSFSAATNTGQMHSGLSELAAMLPPPVQIWCGGSAVGLARCTLPAFRYVDLDTAGAQVRAWEHQHARSEGASAERIPPRANASM